MSATTTITLQETKHSSRGNNRRDNRGEEVANDVGDLPRLSSHHNSHEEAGNTIDETPPANAHVPLQRWNHPRGNVWRLAFAFLSFIIAGMNDAAIGALIPYLESYYDLNYTIVSLIFLTPFAGYSVAAFVNARIHAHYGQRGIAFIAPICHIITFAVLAAHPPFPVLIVVNAISGFGNGLTDACFCAWVGVMDKANAVQGCLHACYSLGALFAPLIATSMVVHYHLDWYNFYYIMIGISVFEWIGMTITFWRKNKAAYHTDYPRDTESSGAGTRQALKSKVTWLAALFLFTYMGVEVGLGGWIVTFMLRVRKAPAFASGASGSGFWAGQAAGRAGLGFVTERFGERICISIYLVICVGLELLFWLVPQFIVSAVAVAFLGFFLGPMFPGAVTMAAKLLPKQIHVSAIGFAMAIGGTGGTVFPFIIGAISAHKGVGVLQPIILALVLVLSGVWLTFPKVRKRD